MIVVSLLASCSKNDKAYYVTPAGNPDTLSAGWTLTAGPANAGSITDIKFTDPNHGFLTSAAGIFKSADGGATWTPFYSSAGYFSIASLGSNACFVNGSNTILHASNSTSATPVSYSSAQGFSNCFYASPDVCYAINSNSVWKSNDGGAFFSTQYTFPTSYTGNSIIMFTDELEGVAARGAALYSTYNGGSSWNQVATAGSIITSLLDQNGSYVYYTTNTGLFRSFNGGSTSSPVLQFPPVENADIEFVNSTLLYLSAGSVIYKSTDGGNAWSKVVSLAPGKNIAKIYFNDLNHGWACGNFGVLKFSD